MIAGNGIEDETTTIPDVTMDDNNGSNHEETTTTTTEEKEHDVPDNQHPVVQREWVVHGARIMTDEEYDLFVERTTMHLLAYRNDPIVENEQEEEEEDLTLYPFIVATVADDLTTVKTLLEQETNGDHNITTNLGRTAMWYAAWKGHLEILQLFIEHGNDMEKSDGYGRTPLFMASIKGHVEIVRHLLEQGANRDTTCNIGWTPLHNAAEHNHVETAKLLMIYGANLNLRTRHGNNLPIDHSRTLEMREAIHDEPRRRMDHGHKRATESEDMNATEGDDDQEGEPSNKRSGGEEEEDDEVADEDQDSEASDGEDDVM